MANRKNLFLRTLCLCLMSFVLLLADSTLGSSAPEGGPNLAKNSAILQHVSVLHVANGVDVQIVVSQQVSPEASLVHSPERLIVEFPNALVFGARKIAVGTAGVIDVRIAQHSTSPLTTRLVIDLERPCLYKVLTNGTNVSVQLRPLPGTDGAQPDASSQVAQQGAASGSKTAARRESARADEAYKYTGSGGCAASSCHGSVQPKMVTRIFQNEYTIWVGQDKHANAYAVLSNPVSERMKRVLAIGPPNQAPRCLACHALNIVAEERAQTLSPEDGVSCESCHGPSSGWLGPHVQANWTHEKSVALGMYDTRNLVRRSEKCASCHVGSAERFVDHEMIAAGHPDLTFEQGYFSRAMPPHWKQPDDPWLAVKAWSVSQALELSASLRRLAWRAGLPRWPEYAELDCFACHHDLTAPNDSWRQMEGYPGRRPGTPPWNAARYAVFRYVAEQVNPELERQLRSSIINLARLMAHAAENGAETASVAQGAAELSDQIARQLDAKHYDQRFTLQLMRSIVADGEDIAQQGERAAEEAYMSLDSLFNAYQQNSKPANDADIQAAISGLRQQFNNPSAYSAPRFAVQMQKVHSALGREGPVTGAGK